MARKLRVLALGAHPDDMEWHAGGTLARYARAGHKVFICHSSNGNKGSMRYTSEELAKVRRKESIAAAKVIGATSLTCDIPDAELTVTVENQHRIVEAVRQARPDVVIATDPNDYHGDHRAVGEMAIHCTYVATCPLYKTRSPATKVVPTLYFCDTSSGLGFEPTDWVDITDVIGLKKKMMLAHKSQFSWLADRGRENIVLDEFFAVARFRGIQCRAKYAEAFRLCPTAGRPRTYRVLP